MTEPPAGQVPEPPSGQPDDLQPTDADSDHTPGDYAPSGYDDRQDSGDSSAEESREDESSPLGDTSPHGGRESV